MFNRNGDELLHVCVCIGAGIIIGWVKCNGDELLCVCTLVLELSEGG